MDGVREAQEQRLESVAVCCCPDRQRSHNRSCSKAVRPTKRFVGDWVSHGGGNWMFFVHNCRLGLLTPDWKVLAGVMILKRKIDEMSMRLLCDREPIVCSE